MKIQIAALLPLVIATSNAFADAPAKATKINSYITVASDVSAQESKTLAADLAYLKTVKPQANDAQLQQMMGTKVTEPAMEQWLSDRVQYIISDKTDLQNSIGVVNQPFSYPNPSVLPTQVTNQLSGNSGNNDQPASQPAQQPSQGKDPNQGQDPSQGQAVTVMLNIGGGLYLAGKASNQLLGINIAGVGGVALTSPRVGVVQIGEGMFMPLLQKEGVASTQSRAYTIFHLAVLFHEARHSDGNGLSLGFVHSLCPIGNDYAGLSACDNSTNGAYTMGATVLRNLTASCKDCTAADTEALKLETLDSYSRVLTQSPTNEQLGLVQSVCQIAAKDPSSVPAEDKDAITQKCPAILAMPNPMIKATALDARPEGQR